MLEEMNDNLPQADGQNSIEPIENVVEISAEEAMENHLAEASENGSIHENIEIPAKNYEALSMEELVDELSTLLAHDKIAAIKNHVEEVRKSFMDKFHHFIDEKRKEFYEQNDGTAEFEYHSPLKVKFDHIFDEYKARRTKHFNQIQNQLKANFVERTNLIEELKALIDNGESNMSDMFKKFNDIRDRWKKAGAIPKDKYNLIWNNFHFHTDRFYELVHLDKEVRDADFKNNLEQKLNIIAKSKQLLQETDLTKAFRELQLLHRVWKEEIGPVDKEHRERIWAEFSEVTKQMHDKREQMLAQARERELQNLAQKNTIIAQIYQLSQETVSTHSDWQKQIAKMEAFRQDFFNTGRVPAEATEETWNNFKLAVRNFNATKNSFYKDIKNEQQHNLERKLALIEKAKSFTETNDFETATPIMKQIQEDWKKIGHVPRKNSDEIWAEFKQICNAYFDRLHDSRKGEIEAEVAAFERKKEYLENLKTFELVGEHKTDLDAIKGHIAAWKELGKVPQNRRHIEGKFNKILDALFEKLSLSKKDSEMMKFANRLDQLSEGNDQRALVNEQLFIRRKIDELQSEIIQLENNIQFISNAKSDNPFIKEVHKSIDRNKEELKLWKEKLKKLNNLA
ncbi:Protein of unknown function [Flavobacterium indicum GPTSA100-9 = DSM 17447]|uniref:Uncharacterized protein n=1 Tax=Flavobacterium indicum (strain DSM 17447 / CIP 109464 / GPTSA100-9) TaxID=1094466 RepID=H8XV25_FLAIG|nr:DUF349 domain-containing protein [Flavobacterium indicum]CCG52995.1 Protein of unknown function [Flavobacterium indicum GPTSA100-9 = DSM 17447]